MVTRWLLVLLVMVLVVLTAVVRWFLVDADHVDGCHHLHADACPHHQHPHQLHPLQVELWQPPGLEEIFNAFVQLLLADKGFHFLRTMKNEARSMTKNHTTRL